MKIRANVPRVFVVFVSIILTVMLCGVFAAEAQQRSLNKNGKMVMKVPEPIPVEPSVMPKSNRYPNLNEHGDVVWQGSDGHDLEIFLYSKGAITQITGNDYDDQNPQINAKGQIVWEGYDGHDWEIFLYSKGTITQITDNEYDDYSPRMNVKGQIVWHGFDGHDNQIFSYSEGTTTQITTVTSDTSPPSGWAPLVGYLQTGYYVQSSPAIGSDGTIYVGSADKNLYAINPDGTQKWAFPSGGHVRSSPPSARLGGFTWALGTTGFTLSSNKPPARPHHPGPCSGETPSIRELPRDR